MTRGGKKRLMRAATWIRIRAEREALVGNLALTKNGMVRRWSEGCMLASLDEVPSVFFFAEAIAAEAGIKYDRPMWAAQRYGAR